MFEFNFALFLRSRLVFSPIRHLVAVLASVMSLWGFPENAYAQTEADRATARNLAAEGYTALKTLDYTTAEDRFRRADALVHAPTLVVDHARALIGLGRYVEAQERLELVLREGVPESAPWVWKKSIQDATELVNEVKPKVCWLTINITGSAEPLVTVDGVPVPVAALGVRRATDPGPRRISATAKGFSPKELTLALPEGSERAVTLELSADPGENRPSSNVAVATPKPAVQRSNPPKPASNTLAYAAVGLGGAGLAVGAVTGVLFLGAHSELRKECPGGTCPKSYADYDDTHRRYVTYGTVSGVALSVGLVSSIAGVWLFLSDGAEENVVRARQARQAPYVTPYVTNHSVGFAGEF